MNNCMFQPLESRAMLSATVHADNPQLVADRQQLQADIQQYVMDSKSLQSTMSADRAAINADQKAINNAKKSARSQYELDKKAMLAALRADSLASKPVHDQFYPILIADTAAVKADHENPDQLAIDQAKLTSDLAAFHTANAPFEAQTHADISHWNDILAADRSAIDSAGGSLDQLNADKANAKTDESHFRDMLKADATKIKADNTQIKTDRGSNEPDHTTPEHTNATGHK